MTIQFPKARQNDGQKEICLQIMRALSRAKFPMTTPRELLNTMPADADACYKASAEQAADTIAEWAEL